jgi:hypothetical protein
MVFPWSVSAASQVFTAHTRNATGVVDVAPPDNVSQLGSAFTSRYDMDQFKVADVLNLVSRCGMQVGIGAGRPDSKASAGCGFGLFNVVATDLKRSNCQVRHQVRQARIGRARRGEVWQSGLGGARLGRRVKAAQGLVQAGMAG